MNITDLLSIFSGIIVGIRKLISMDFSFITNIYADKEYLVGQYHGYYLHRDKDSEPVKVKCSSWEISKSFKRNIYKLRVYKQKSGRTNELKYKGELWKESGHYLFILNATKYTETIYGRLYQITNPNEEPLIGIAIAVNPKHEIRANAVLISPQNITLQEDTLKSLLQKCCDFEPETCNMIMRNRK